MNKWVIRAHYIPFSLFKKICAKNKQFQKHSTIFMENAYLSNWLFLFAENKRQQILRYRSYIRPNWCSHQAWL